MMRAALLGAVLLAWVAVPLRASDPSPEALAEGGQYKRLRAIVEPRVQANPNDAQANYLLSQVRLAFADLDAALPLAEKAVALDGANAKYHFQLGRVCAQMAQRAGIFKGMSLAGRTKKEFEAAMALDPKDTRVRLALMEFYWEAPGIAGGDKNKARGLAEQIVALDPARGYLAQAELAEKEKKNELLEGLYLKALEADPRYYEARLTLAALYGSEAQKKYDLAEMHAREALKLDPGRQGAYSVLAQLFARQQHWQELDGILAEVEKKLPNNLNAFFQAARVLLGQGKELPRAEGYFRKYLTQEPEGNMPRRAAAHWRLGLVLEKQGRKPEATAELETAVRLEPNFEPAKKDLERLK